MKSILSFLSFFLLVNGMVPATPSTRAVNQAEQSYLQLAESFLEAKEKSYQQQATKRDVIKFLQFFSDTLRYDHVFAPGKKFVATDKATMQRGMISHLGETKNVSIKITNSIIKQNIVVVSWTLQREIVAGGKKEVGNIVSVITFDGDRKISALTDYL